MCSPTPSPRTFTNMYLWSWRVRMRAGCKSRSRTALFPPESIRGLITSAGDVPRLSEACGINPKKKGRNYYCRRAVILTGPKLIFYFKPEHEPLVNQLGIWEVTDSEEPERFFDAQGLCTAPERLIEDLRIPLHEPKILVGSQRFESLDPQPKFFETDFRQPAGWANLVNNFQPVPSPDYLEPVLGSTFVPGFVGYAAHEAKQADDRPPEHQMEVGYSGFRDINDDWADR